MALITTPGNRTVGYDDVGTGLPVLFLHGFPHDRSLWGPQMGGLATPVRTIAVDLRGFGESRGPAVTQIEEYVDDVLAFLDERGLETVVVTGLSMGGYVAFALWRRAPERVRALVLSDTKAPPDTDEARAKRAEQIALVEEKGSGALADLLLPGMLGKSTRASHPDLVERVYTMLARAPIAGITGGLRAMAARADSTATLETISVPALIVVGEEDVLTPVADARALHAGIRGSRLEIIPAAGHLTGLERPAAFNHVLSEFLATLTYQ